MPMIRLGLHTVLLAAGLVLPASLGRAGTPASYPGLAALPRCPVLFVIPVLEPDGDLTTEADGGPNRIVLKEVAAGEDLVA
ncbi:MAG: hypothetical protein HY815_34345, partial [Candidatus Riflebacteria bacterium]|nr:hypothetical protein [Candidatus Riflebacteria bacterium]